MYLTLEVVSSQAPSLGDASRQVVGPDGLRIGRSTDNDWVLPDPYISKQHARIFFDGTQFLIEGLGRNPIALGRADNPIPARQPRPLRVGDRLFIDQYEVLVTLLQDEAGTVPEEALSHDESVTERLVDEPPALMDEAHEPTADELLDAGLHGDSSAHEDWAPRPAPPPRRPPPPPAAARQETDPVDPGSGPFSRPGRPVPRGRSQGAAPPPRAPAPGRAPPGRPSAATDPSRALSGRTPTPRGGRVLAPAEATGEFDVVSLLQAAGVPERDWTPDLAQELGQILRISIEGVMEMLRARAEIKSQFQLPLTRVQAKENNPLKLMPNVESVLHTLLVQRNSAYLPAMQAFDDAFDDIRNHQAALLTGLRAAFDSLLAAFDPQQLQREAEASGRGRGLLGGKSRYWDHYVERYEQLGADSEETFRRLCGEVFAEAYEHQLELLKRGG